MAAAGCARGDDAMSTTFKLTRTIDPATLDHDAALAMLRDVCHGKAQPEPALVDALIDRMRKQAAAPPKPASPAPPKPEPRFVTASRMDHEAQALLTVCGSIGDMVELLVEKVDYTHPAQSLAAALAGLAGEALESATRLKTQTHDLRSRENAKLADPKRWRDAPDGPILGYVLVSRHDGEVIEEWANQDGPGIDFKMSPAGMAAYLKERQEGQDDDEQLTIRRATLHLERPDPLAEVECRNALAALQRHLATIAPGPKPNLQDDDFVPRVLDKGEARDKWMDRHRRGLHRAEQDAPGSTGGAHDHDAEQTTADAAGEADGSRATAEREPALAAG